MALKAFDGFDHYNSGGAFGGDLFARSGFIQYDPNFLGASSVSFVAGINGDGSAVTGNYLRATYAARNATAIIGQAIKFPANAPANNGWIFLLDSLGASLHTCQISILFNPGNNSISVYRGSGYVGFESGNGTLLLTTANNVMVPTQANYVEIQATIDPSAGAVAIYLNGSATPVVNITGANTRNSANSVFDQAVWFGLTNTMVLDDHYYCDTVVGPGSFPCNAPLGSVHCETLFAIGNDQAQWSPNPNTNANWQNVNEAAMDSDTTYNSSATPGQEDRFNYQSLPGVVSAVFGAQVTGAYRKDDAGTRTVKQALKSGVTEVYGANDNLASSAYGYFTDLFVLDPNTSASWTNAAINAVKAGYNLVA